MKRFLSIALIALSALFAGCSQIDTGNVGVESTLGQVKPEVLPPGMYFTLFKSVNEVCGTKELPLSITDLKPQTSDKITLADVDVDIYIQTNGAMASKIMTRWPGDRMDVKDEGCTRVGMNFVTKQAREAIYNIASTLSSATIHTERTKIASELVKNLQKDLDESAGKGIFTVVSANVRNLVTDPALEANIKATAQAHFKLQEERNLLEVTKVQADRKRAEAQGEADAIQIKAAAVSKQSGAEYVQLQWIGKWNGALPTTQLSGGATPLINLPK